MTETFVINQSITQFKNPNLQHAREKTAQQDPC